MNAYADDLAITHADGDWQAQGKGAQQGLGNATWIPPDLEAKAQHHEMVSAVFHLNNKEAKCELKVNFNNETLPFCSDPKYLGVTLDRSVTYHRQLESLRKKLISRVAILRRLAGSGWSNNVVNSCLSPGAFNSSVLRSSLVPQCSYPPHRPHHQRRLANCDWLPAFYTSGQPSHPRKHPTRWASSQWSPSPVCHDMEPGHLLHSALTCLPGANGRRLKSRHPFVLAAQPISSSWRQQQKWCALRGSPMECGVVENTTRLCTFNPDTGTTLLEWLSQEQCGSGLTASAPVSDVSTPACTNGEWPPLRPVSMAQKNKPSTMLSSNVQSIASPRTAWPDGSGWWDNRMAAQAQHLPRDPMWPSSGYEQLAQTMKKALAVSHVVILYPSTAYWKGSTKRYIVPGPIRIRAREDESMYNISFSVKKPKIDGRFLQLQRW